MGDTLGIAKKAQVIMHTSSWDLLPRERHLLGLVAQADDIKRQNRQGKAVISMSWGTTVQMADRQMFVAMGKSEISHFPALSLSLSLSRLALDRTCHARAKC